MLKPMFLRPLGGVVLVVAIMACSSPSATTSLSTLASRIPLPSNRSALPDHEPCVFQTEVPPSVLCVDAGHAILGTLYEGGGCIWSVLDNGDQVRLVWPYGYSAQMNPFVVFDNNGQSVLQAGDRFLAGGSGPFVGDLDTCGRQSYVVLNNPIQKNPTQ